MSYHNGMRKLVLVCGPAGIGKSTFSKGYIESHPEENVEILAADDVRKDMYGSYQAFPPNKNMMIVYDKMIEIAHAEFEEHENLTMIFDTTMLYDERRMYFQRNLKDVVDSFEMYLLKLHDYSICLERNKKRPEEKWVPEEVIISMINGYTDPTEEVKSHFDVVKTVYVD